MNTEATLVELRLHLDAIERRIAGVEDRGLQRINERFLTLMQGAKTIDERWPDRLHRIETSISTLRTAFVELDRRVTKLAATKDLRRLEHDISRLRAELAGHSHAPRFLQRLRHWWRQRLAPVMLTDETP